MKNDTAMTCEQHNAADSIVASITVVDLNRIDREVLILAGGFDLVNGRALVDIGVGEHEDECWIPIKILDDSASDEEWQAFTALFEPEAVALRRRARMRAIKGGRV